MFPIPKYDGYTDIRFLGIFFGFNAYDIFPGRRALRHRDATQADSNVAQRDSPLRIAANEEGIQIVVASVESLLSSSIHRPHHP